MTRSFVSITVRGGLAAVVFALCCAASAQDLTGRKWEDMDYGPFLTTCIEIDEGNFAYKGIAIRLDGTEGGVSRGGEWMVFDTDTLCWSAGWSGRFLDWRSIVYDGSHQTHVKLAGPRHFLNPQSAGWARPGTEDFDAPRVEGKDGKGYGPIERSWGRYRGLYSQQGPPILEYTVGDSTVFERPSGVDLGPHRAMVRSLVVDPSSEELRARVLTESGLVPRVLEGLPGAVQGIALSSAGASAPTPTSAAFEGDLAYQVESAADFEFAEKDYSLRARIRTEHGGTILCKTSPGAEWVPDGTTWFVRGGRLCFDIGWVGVVSSSKDVADGEWHDVAMTFDHFEGLVRLYIDGERVGQEEMSTKEAQPEDWVLRLGYTASDFPDPSAFVGEIESVRVYQRLVDPAVEPDAEGLIACWRFDGEGGETIADSAGGDHVARRITAGGSRGRAADHAKPDTIVLWRPMAVDTDGERAPMGRLHADSSGAVQLVFDPSDSVSGGDLFLIRVDDADEALPGVIAGLDAAPAGLPPAAIQGVRRGNKASFPRRWHAEPVTEVKPLGKTEGPWVVDDLSVPLDNPYHSWFRVGGFDFTADGDGAAVATWMGDVWFVRGLSADDGELRWQRFAAGLYQPLGLKIVDGTVYVAGRDQITRLVDHDGDGEADEYECFNNDHQVTEHFHEFAMALQTDADGNLFFMKGACHAKDCTVPHHGTLIRVSPDGEQSEILATGFRAPNGLQIDEDGSFYTSDQEGHWTPANCIKRVVEGGFYGYRWGYREGGYPQDFDAPLCWIDHDFDRSPGAPVRVEGDRWGPVGGQMLSLSYGTGQIALVLREEVEGTWQGGVTRLPIETFPTGIMRGRFHPGDGQLYAAGLFGWSSQRTLSGGLYRIRWTGADVDLPVAAHATTEGLVLRFTRPLDPDRSARTGAWEVKRWNYRYAQRYGSDDFRVSDGKPGREDQEVTAVRMSADGRSVLLQFEDFQPCHQMSVKGRLQTADGGRFSPELYLTVHTMGSFERFAAEFGLPE